MHFREQDGHVQVHLFCGRREIEIKRYKERRCDGKKVSGEGTIVT